MKLISSIKKELILATRSFYFYIEIFFAVVLLAVLLFAIPEHIHVVETQYMCLDLPDPVKSAIIGIMLENDLDGKPESATVEAGGQKFTAVLIENADEKKYILENEEAVRTLADISLKIGALVTLGSDGELQYRYYLQGYESARLKNLISVLHAAVSDEFEQRFDEQPVQILTAGYSPLNDRENTIPTMLAFNSCFMGMFVMTAYVFLDKKEGVINAYAVTASSVSRYLLSKIFVALLTGTVSAIIVTLPVMGLRFNVGLALLLLWVSSFFAASLGLLVASFYDDITKSFGTVFPILILLMVPVISYFLPGWNPFWVKLIPSDFVIQGFKEILLPDGDHLYALLVSIAMLAAGSLLFIGANAHFKKTLSA